MAVASLKTRSLSLITPRRSFSSLKTGSRSLITPSHRLASPVGASQTAIDMMRMISDKEDEEIIAELNKCQNAWAKPIQFIVDLTSVIIASNPYLRGITEMINPKDLSSYACNCVAICSTYSALVECSNYIFYNQPPHLGIIAIGYAIYKTTLWNYYLLKKGKNPIWTPVIITLNVAKICLDLMMLTRCETVAEMALESIHPISSIILCLSYIVLMSLSKAELKETIAKF